MGRHGAIFNEVMEEPTRAMGYKKFLQILKPYFAPRNVSDRIRAFSCFACLGAAKVCSIMGPVYLGNATDELAAGTFPVTSLILFSGLAFGSKGFNELQRIIYLRVKEVAGVELAETSFAHVQTLSLNWHLTKKSGVVLRAMDRGVQSASTVVDMLFLRLVPTVVELLVLVVIFATVLNAPWPSLSLFVGFTLYAVITYLLTRWRRKIRTRQNRVDNEANQRAVEALTNFETVKYFTNEHYELDRYSDSMRRYMRASKQAEYSLGSLHILQELIMKLTQLSVLLLAARQVLDGPTTVGDFVTINSYVVQVFIPLSFLGTIYGVLINSYTDMTNLADLLEEKPDVTDKPDAINFYVNPSKGAEIEFKDVWFKYPKKRGTIVDTRDEYREGEDLEGQRESIGKSEPNKSNSAKGKTERETAPLSENIEVKVGEEEEPEERYVLKGISFKIPPGTTTAVVGQTGAGKSTLSRLLFRFFDVSQGQVLINGYDLRDLTQKSLRQSLGIVPQDTTLFNDTMEYNLRYGKPEASEEELEKAVSDASLTELIRQLPEGYESLVGERGLKLSGGEKQRVAIARTLLKDPPVLILDEATSSLDSRTEAEIQDAIAKVRSGRTVLIIAHRLSTIKDADNILVLDEGKVVESGNHEQLLEKRGYYCSLWEQQVYGKQQKDTNADDDDQENATVNANHHTENGRL
eukprot:gb/GECG01007596.1/.p1 GENE.gb/GECG01007596.1/~~gb/GECG01007596.1/.p1  ORF type:complete len:692 (+),score=88.52 gb/GECG01007596.1/:1-2076(+)